VTRRRTPAIALISFALACADGATSPRPLPQGAVTARGPSASAPRYKLQFVFGVDSLGDGEIRSASFPDTGVVLNTRAPWKSLTVSGVTIDLVNFTHGSWSSGTCATFAISATVNQTNWDVATTGLSFAGRWRGTVAISQMNGTSVSFDGDRIVDTTVTPAAGGIHNVVTNANFPRETKDPTGKGEWFQLQLRSAAMKFGSASTPDGSSNPPGAEVACANFTIRAEKVT
jgi:hypothetical protein